MQELKNNPKTILQEILKGYTWYGTFHKYVLETLFEIYKIDHPASPLAQPGITMRLEVEGAKDELATLYFQFNDLCKAYFSLQCPIGQLNYIWSADTWVSEDKRMIGIGAALMQLKIMIQDFLRCDMLCTVNRVNEVERALLTKNNWNMLDATRTVLLYIRKCKL